MSQYKEEIFGFADKESITNDFSVTPDVLENAFVIHAEYNYGDYCGDAHVLFVRGGKMYEVHGSHCSCYGLEDQWDEEETFPEAAIKQSCFQNNELLQNMLKDNNIMRKLTQDTLWSNKDEEQLNALLLRKQQAADAKKALRAQALTYFSKFVTSQDLTKKNAQLELANAMADNIEEIIQEFNQ